MDESLVGAVEWSRVLCVSQRVLKLASGTWRLMADLAYGASLEEWA